MSDITFYDGVEVAIVSMAIVFLILTLIMICLSFFKLLGKLEKTKVEEVKITKSKQVNRLNTDDEDMVVACLVATIDASNEYGCDLRVVNVKEIGRV